MKLTSDFIIVFFDTAAVLTLTTEEKKKNLYTALQAEDSLPENSCIQKLSLRYSETIDFNKIDGRGIHIDPLWYKDERKPLSCAPECAGNCDRRTRMRICAENLKTGKCQDAFMRRTLGATLFPKLYITEKQK
ncbi:MAG: hypothetical protein K2M34_00425 [Alphaproteobacteria bacterium]|nr:hypothetical protein [Alphaproteobacteria bacterium]